MVTLGERGSADDELDAGEIHDVLRNDRRRLTLEALREAGGESTVRDLSEMVAARETGKEPPPRDKRQSVYVSLHQTHLPKLDELGIVQYDADNNDVRLGEKVKEVEVYMEVVPEYGLSWAEAYLGLACLGLLVTIADLTGVPGISSMRLTYLAVGFFGLQLAAATYHVYSHQERTVVGRLLE